MFEIAVTSTFLLFWTILLHRFEAHQPRWRLILRCGLAIGLAVLIGHYAGRDWFWAFLTAAHLPAAYLHLWWLPRRGVNGLTAEPYDRYLALIGRAPKVSAE